MRQGRHPTGALCLALAASVVLAEPAVAQHVGTPKAEVQILRPRAEAGDAESQYQLALRALQGKGTKRDLVEGARWLGRAADQGHAPSRALLDQVLAGDYARPGDVDALVEIYEERAEAGDPLACTKLGLMYRDGIGVGSDDEQAMRWLERGAEKGDVEAEAALGSMFDEGRGAARDRARAATWFRKAAERGHAGAQFALGSMVVQGDGVPKDVPEGLMWLELSRDQEHSARYLLFRLESELDPAQLAEGRQRADAWRAAHGLAPASATPQTTPAAPQPEPL